MWVTMAASLFLFGVLLEFAAEASPVSLQDWVAKRSAATEAYRAGKYQDAELLGREALAAAGPEESEALALSSNELGLTLSVLSKYAEALPYFARAVAVEARLYPHDSPALAAAYNNLGGIYYRLGKYADADKNFRQAIEIFDLTDNSTNPQFIATLNNYGALCYHAGRYPDAELLFTRGLRLGEGSAELRCHLHPQS